MIYYILINKKSQSLTITLPDKNQISVTIILIISYI